MFVAVGMCWALSCCRVVEGVGVRVEDTTHRSSGHSAQEGDVPPTKVQAIGAWTTVYTSCQHLIRIFLKIVEHISSPRLSQKIGLACQRCTTLARMPKNCPSS